MLISQAWAQAAPAAPQQGGELLSLLPLVVIFIIMYFVMIRPQMKRAKEHKAMAEGLQKGDEVVTGGGALGRVVKVSGNYVAVEIAPGIEITVQKNTIQTLLPKGTIKSVT